MSSKSHTLTTIGLRNREESASRIDAKIEAFRRILESEVADLDLLPKSKNKFRLWTDPERGLERIGSPNTLSETSSPHNLSRIREVTKLIAEAKKRSKKPIAQRRPMSDLLVIRRKLVKAEEIIQGLTMDIHLAREEACALRRSLEREKRASQTFHSQAAELRRDLIAAQECVRFVSDKPNQS